MHIWTVFSTPGKLLRSHLEKCLNHKLITSVCRMLQGMKCTSPFSVKNAGLRISVCFSGAVMLRKLSCKVWHAGHVPCPECSRIIITLYMGSNKRCCWFPLEEYALEQHSAATEFVKQFRRKMKLLWRESSC